MCFLSNILDSRLSEFAQMKKELEMKDNLVQKTRLEIKELDYIKETYHEIQHQAKVSLFIIVLMRI